MSKFELIVTYDFNPVYESGSLDFVSCIADLNEVIDTIYSFNKEFGDLVFETSNFNFVIKEVV